MEELYRIFLQNPLVCTDTRQIVKGSLFFCLKGEHFNGNDFALEAIHSGAALSITDDPSLANEPGCYYVKDTLQSLQQLSLYHRKHMPAPVIGITGTNGKTTTKELVTSVLARKYRVCSTQGNLNNHIGVPLTLLSIRPDDEIIIVEMGANHPGEIAELCTLALPDYGLITNIGKAHMEGFGSYENIVQTKVALYDAVISRKGTLFLNEDELLLQSYATYENVVKYSAKKEAHISGSIESVNPYLTLFLFGRNVRTAMTGYYNIYNVLAAAAIGNYFKIEESKIIEAIASYTPANHRSQVSMLGSLTIIEDFYNANPTSMEAALWNLAQVDVSDRIAILGDMLELGSDSYAEHHRIVKLAESLNIRAFYIGMEFEKVGGNKDNFFRTVEEFNEKLGRSELFASGTLLLKGSRGIHLERLAIIQDKEKSGR